MKWLPLVLLLAGCLAPNRCRLIVEFMDRPDLPYADELQVCSPKADQTMRCVGLGGFRAAVKKELREQNLPGREGTL